MPVGTEGPPAPEPVRPWPQPLVLGHAGSGFFTPFMPFNPLPPSSLRSINRALRHQAAGVEVDIRLSQDGVPVLYHDHTLTSMTNGQGCVSQTSAAELQRLRYRGGWPYDWFQHEQISTFETLLAQLAKRPTFPLLHLDLHEDDACSANDTARSRTLARQLVALLGQYQVPLERVLILTNRPATLAYLRQLQPSVPLGLEFTDEFEQGMASLATTDVQAVVLHKDDISPERVARLHAMGREVVVFGGRSGAALKRVVAAHPDAYEVDNVRRLRHQLRHGGTSGAPSVSLVRPAQH
ncbi:glycerophosphodiester phosphodiesterase [Hymenobacter fodinae]|nr:glycerophosphodiester phosphodiesterase family protein [Hymenobacter fodinae]